MSNYEFGQSPDRFTQVTGMYGNQIAVKPEERRMLAEAAATYPEFADVVAPLGDIAREWAARPDRRRHEELPERLRPLGVGVESVAYSLEWNGGRYVARFPSGDDDDQTSMERMQVRLLALARSELTGAAYLEQLVTYSFANPIIVTKEGRGTPPELLQPNQLLAVPDHHLLPLRAVATRMTAGNLAMDMDRNAMLQRHHARYDYQNGPTFFDVEISEDSGSFNTPGLNFADLTLAFVAFPKGVDDYDGLRSDQATARILFLERTYRMLKETWPEDSFALQMVARTAFLLHQPLSHGMFLQEAKRLTGQSAINDNWFFAKGQQPLPSRE